MQNHDIVAIGGSAGSFAALREIATDLPAAFRTNRERAALLRKMARDAEARSQTNAATIWEERAAEFTQRAKVIHDLLMSTADTAALAPA